MLHLIETKVAHHDKWGSSLSWDFVLPAKVHRIKGLLVDVVPDINSFLRRRAEGTESYNNLIIFYDEEARGANRVLAVTDRRGVSVVQQRYEGLKLTQYRTRFASDIFSSGAFAARNVGSASVALGGLPLVSSIPAVVTSSLVSSSMGSNIVKFDPVSVAAGQVVRVSLEESIESPFMGKNGLMELTEEIGALAEAFRSLRKKLLLSDVEKMRHATLSCMASYYLSDETPRVGWNSGGEGRVLEERMVNALAIACRIKDIDKMSNGYTLKVYFDYD